MVRRTGEIGHTRRTVGRPPLSVDASRSGQLKQVDIDWFCSSQTAAGDGRVKGKGKGKRYHGIAAGAFNKFNR